ncbi:hypothetical protein FPRO05_03100 [Fusarium proliferatum]|uniref:Uncharacterized protein n=1 Tax=Gibberella intermedia TaxID=948311 RepID=A0A365N125_GIBIN|nr:hypothetical protein FPRO05_03100 [Fusarium proliferatum]
MSEGNAAFELEEYTVGWVCAIPLEMAAARGMLDKIHPDLSQQDPDDHNSYILGEICGHKIVIACLPAGIHGTNPAATVAKDLLRTFKSIRFGLMVGIGGGAPSLQHDIRLGDVVVGQPSGTLGGVVQHDRGKILPQGGFQRTGSLNAPPQLLLSALARLQATHMTEDSRVPEYLAQLVAKSPKRMKGKFSYPGTLNDRLYKAGYEHANPGSATCGQCDESKRIKRETRDDNEPYFHYGIIASGNHLIKDGKTRKRLSQAYGALCFEMEAAGLHNFPCLVIRGICDYADSHKNDVWQEYAAATAAAFAKELLLFVAPSQVLQENKILSDLVSIVKGSLEVSIHSLTEQRSIKYVAPPIDAHSARYDSQDVKESPRCQTGTRVRILESIEQWAAQPLCSSIFWLIGPAGTGKSTIARSVTDSFARKDRLAAGYFFKRGEQDRNDTNRLFSTLAMQLADTVSSFKESLRKSLEGLDKDAVEKTNLDTQFQKLLWWPLENLQVSDASGLPKVITIDALDECERPEHLLRVLITSRSAPDIVEALDSHLQDGTARTLEIQREFPEDTKLDIQNFLQSSFEEIKNKRRVQKEPWPTTEDLNRLVQLSTTPEPLFIYAATLCRFVSDKQQGPIRQLIIWLEHGSHSQLHQIYTPILDQAFLGFGEVEFSQKLRFLGAITVIARPLSAKSLATILAIDLDDVSWWVSRLYAVLHVPPVLDKPIHLLHKSFADFLATSDDSDAAKYGIDVAGRLLECIGLLDRLLKASETCKDDILPDFVLLLRDAKRVLSAFGSTIDLYPLQIYGSLLFFSPTASTTRQRFWDQRIPKTGRIQGVESKWTASLQTFENPDGILILLSFSPDAQILASVVRKHSGLSVIQLRNIISGTYEFTFELNKGVNEVYWNLMAFSSDSCLLLSDQCDGNFGIWDVRSGQVQQISTGRCSPVLAVNFAPHSNHLSCLSKDGRLQYWENVKGIYQEKHLGINVLNGTSDKGLQILRATFSRSSQLLAFQKQPTEIEVWDLKTGAQTLVLSTKTHFIYCYIMEFSADSQSLALAGHNVLTVWDLETGAKKLSLEHQMMIDSIAFSPTGRMIASGSGELIQLWDLDTGICKTTLMDDGHYGVTALAFSGDGSNLASPHRLWDLTQRQELQIHDGRSPAIGRIVWSLDGRLLASPSKDGTIQVQDAETLMPRWKLTGHTKTAAGNAFELLFSDESSLLASLHSDYILKVWDMRSGTECTAKRSSVSQVNYSEDGLILATTMPQSHIVNIWEAETSIHLHTLNVPKDDDSWASDLSTVFSPDGRILVTYGVKDSPILWDTSTSKQGQKLPVSKPVIEVIFSHDSRLIASIEGFRVSISRLSACQRPLHILETQPRKGAFSSDNKLLVISGIHEEFGIWDIETGSKILEVESSDSSCEAMCLSPNTQFIAFASTRSTRPEDGRIRLWNIASQPPKSLTLNHQEIVSTMVFSSDGRVLAMASGQNVIWLWNVTSGILIRKILCQEVFIKRISFSSDEILVSVSKYRSPAFFNVWDNMALQVHRYQITSSTGKDLPKLIAGNIGLTYDENWIARSSENLIWVPRQYRPPRADFSGRWVSRDSTIIIGIRSGHLIRFQIV